MKHLNIVDEKFECKQYLSTLPLEKAPSLFKHKYKMTENVKINYKNDQEYSNSLWRCSSCSNQDTESHLLWCQGFSDMRIGLNLKDDSDLCSYLQKIFAERCKEKKWQFFWLNQKLKDYFWLAKLFLPAQRYWIFDQALEVF